MPEFDTSHVKNIVLLGHVGSGKTTLAECMLFEAGIINRRGSIAERNTTGVIPSSANYFTQNGRVIKSISWTLLDTMIL